MRVVRPEIEAGIAANLERVYSSDEYQALDTVIDVLEISLVQAKWTASWSERLDHDSLLKRLQVSLCIFPRRICFYRTRYRLRTLREHLFLLYGFYFLTVNLINREP